MVLGAYTLVLGGLGLFWVVIIWFWVILNRFWWLWLVLGGVIWFLVLVITTKP